MSAVPALAEAVSRIDWQRPWLDPLQAKGRAMSDWVSNGATASEALQKVDALGSATGNQAGVAFVAASTLPAATFYESHVGRTGQVPTRDNLHDVFNGLVWMAYPQTKQRLNHWQVTEIDRAGGTRGRPRGALRDALTVLDENGAFLRAPDAIWQALAARAWQRLFVELRPLWQQAHLVLLGHALLEKLVQPRKAITAHVLRLPTDGASEPSAIDAAMTASVSPKILLRRPAFLPLPVLGVPGWWSANEQCGFYDDAQVFRSKRGETTAS